MAIKGPGPTPDRVKDVDDAIADRLHGRKKETDGPREGKAAQQTNKAVARKPGHVIDTPGAHVEEHVAEPDEKGIRGEDVRQHDQDEGPKRKKKPEKKERTKDRGQDDRQQERESDRPMITAGHLQHDDNYHRSRTAKNMGFDQSPDVGEYFSDDDDEGGEGDAMHVVLPSARARGHPDLPEAEMRPPDFLKPLEAMKDIYMRTRGRMSRRTKELLEGVDLEDLLDVARALHDDDHLVKNSEAHLKHTITAHLKDDPGPMLLGLHDPRLTEPWRLFLDGWEIWVPDGEEDGVDLFWEGEAEEDDGTVIELLQSLTYRNGELTLHAKLGDNEDRVTFDGETFYRLRSDQA